MNNISPVGNVSDTRPTNRGNSQLVIPSEVLSILDEIKFYVQMNKDTFTMKELVMYTGLSKQTLYKLTSKRKIPFYSPNGKVLYFDKKEIDKWLKTNRTPTEGEMSQQATIWANENRRK
jgi:excisionase family DNA binding protein